MIIDQQDLFGRQITLFIIPFSLCLFVSLLCSIRNPYAGDSIGGKTDRRSSQEGQGMCLEALRKLKGAANNIPCSLLT